MIALMSILGILFSVSNSWAPVELVPKQNKNPAERPLATVLDSTVCYNATTTSDNRKIWNIKNDNFVGEANYRGLDCGVSKLQINKSKIVSVFFDGRIYFQDNLVDEKNLLSQLKRLSKNNKISHKIIIRSQGKVSFGEIIKLAKKIESLGHKVEVPYLTALSSSKIQTSNVDLVELLNKYQNPKKHFKKAMGYIKANPKNKVQVGKALKLELELIANNKILDFATSYRDIADVIKYVDWKFVDKKLLAKFYIFYKEVLSKEDDSLVATDVIKNIKTIPFSREMIAQLASEGKVYIAHEFLSAAISEDCSALQFAILNKDSLGFSKKVIQNARLTLINKCNFVKPNPSSAELEQEKKMRIALQKKSNEEVQKRKQLEKRVAELEQENKKLSKPKNKKESIPKSNSGSGFFISKLGHIITNHHVVKECSKITVGDNIDRQVPAKLMEIDKKNDLALLRTTTLDLASKDTKSLIKKLSTLNLRMEMPPLATAGLMRSNDVELGEDIVVAGFPYGDIFSKDIKVTFGNVNSTKGVGDNSSQFQIQAPVQIGNSGGPIYDKFGNIVGVVVAQLDKLKMAKTIGSLPENVNFGIKASTVKQFLNSSGLPTKWAERDKNMNNKEISKIAAKQTVMVVCHN